LNLNETALPRLSCCYLVSSTEITQEKILLSSFGSHAFLFNFESCASSHRAYDTEDNKVTNFFAALQFKHFFSP